MVDEFVTKCGGNTRMKSITVSVDEETYRVFTHKAAENGVSVTALVRSYLTDLANGAEEGDDFERFQRLQNETLATIEARGAGLRSADNLPRSELHGPDALS